MMQLDTSGVMFVSTALGIWSLSHGWRAGTWKGARALALWVLIFGCK